MGYYISKTDKEHLVHLIEKMRRSGEDLVINTSTPERLAYLLRNALNVVDEWKELKHKWIIQSRQREGKLYLKLKSIQLDLDIDWIELIAPSFLELSAELFKKPLGIRIHHNQLNESEMFRVQRYCDNAGYKLTDNPPIVEIKKDA